MTAEPIFWAPTRETVDRCRLTSAVRPDLRGHPGRQSARLTFGPKSLGRAAARKIMGLRLSFGFGPLRASVPLTPRRSRRRRASSYRPRASTYQGTARFADGSYYSCHHQHRTLQAAQECAEKYGRQHATGPFRQPPSRQERRASAARRRQFDEADSFLRDPASLGKVTAQIAERKHAAAELEQMRRRARAIGREDLTDRASRQLVLVHQQLAELDLLHQSLQLRHSTADT
jgi:hypothetical protein